MTTNQNLFDPEAPQILVEQVREFIEACNWRAAKTDTSPHPHSYCMRFSAREQGLMSGYWTLVRFIEKYGFERAWRNRFFKSVDIEGRSYWLQDLPEPHEFATDIINTKEAEFGGWNRNQPRLSDWA